MVRLIISLHRHPACPEPAFRQIWKDDHGPAARRLPGVRRCVERGPGPDPCDEGASCDGVVELWFAGPPDLHAALMSPPGRAFLSAIAEQLNPRRFTIAVEPAPAGTEVL
jgi:hypothetical protein